VEKTYKFGDEAGDSTYFIMPKGKKCLPTRVLQPTAGENISVKIIPQVVERLLILLREGSLSHSVDMKIMVVDHLRTSMCLKRNLVLVIAL